MAEKNPEQNDTPQVPQVPEKPERIDDFEISPDEARQVNEVSEDLDDRGATEAPAESVDKPPEDIDKKDDTAIDNAKEKEGNDQLDKVESNGRHGPNRAKDTGEVKDKPLGRWPAREEVEIQRLKSGGDAYREKLNVASRDKDLGSYSSSEIPIIRDDGRGVIGAAKAYETLIDQRTKTDKTDTAEAAADKAEPEIEQVDQDGDAGIVPVVRESEDKTEQVDVDAARAETEVVVSSAEAEADHADIEVKTGRVDPAEASNPGAGQVLKAEQPDKGDHVEAKSTEERVSEDQPVARKIVEAGTEHGHKMHLVLDHIRDTRPDLYEHPDFQGVVMTTSRERALLLSESGAFSEHQAAGKVSFDTIDLSDPQLPDGVALTLGPDVNDLPTTYLVNRKGTTLAAAETTSVIGDAPVVAVSTHGEPVAIRPRHFGKFGTLDEPDQLLELGAKLNDRLFVQLQFSDINGSPVSRLEDSVAEAMTGVPDGRAIGMQPDLPGIIQGLSSQSELVYVDGEMTPKDRRPQPSQNILWAREGERTYSTTEIYQIKEGADAAGASDVFVTPRKPGDFCQALIVNGAVDASAITREFNSIVSAPDNNASQVLDNTMNTLEAEKSGDLGGVSAVDSVRDLYARHLADHPEGKLDYDLALGLADAMMQFGHLDQASEFATAAINMAPQVAARAHTIEAEILTHKGEFDEAAEHFARALSIAPRDPKIFRAMATLAAVEGDDLGYAEARINEQRYATAPLSRNPTETTDAWVNICEALERHSANGAPGDPPQTRVLEYSEFNTESGQWEVKQVSATFPAATVARERVGQVTLAAIDAVRQAHENTSGQIQDPAVQRLQDIYDRARWNGLEPNHLMYVGDDAERALELRELELQEKEALVGEVVGKTAILDSVEARQYDRRTGGVLLGNFITGPGGREIPGGQFVMLDRDGNRHYLVLGSSGAGKTETTKTLLTGQAINGKGMMVFDGGVRPQFKDWAQRMTRLGYPTSYLDPSDENAAAVGLRMMVPEPGYPIEDHVVNIITNFKMMTPVREPFINIAEEALLNMYAQLGHPIRDSTAEFRAQNEHHPYPTLLNTLYALRKASVAAGYGGRLGPEIEAFVDRRALKLIRPPYSRTLEGPANQQFDVRSAILGRTVLDLTRQDEYERKVIAATMGMRLEEAFLMDHMSQGDVGLRFLLHLGEAHGFVGRPTGAGEGHEAEIEQAREFDKWRQGWRGFGVGLGGDTQQLPLLLDSTTSSNETMIAHRTPKMAEREPIIDAMGGDRRDLDNLGSLAQGEALVRVGSWPQSQYVRMFEPPSDSVTLTGNYRLPDARVTGHQPEKLLSSKELDAAEIVAKSPDNAAMRVWVTLLTVEHLTNRELAAPLPDVVRRYQATAPEEFDAILDSAITTVVQKRADGIQASSNLDQLQARIKAVASDMLKGVPIAGKKPGTDHVLEQLEWATSYENLAQPYFAQAPKLTDPAIPVDSRTAAMIGNLPDGATVADQIEALRRHEAAVTAANPANQKAAWIGELGSDSGTSFYRDVERVVGRRGTRFDQFREIAVATGLAQPGNPIPDQIQNLFSWPRRIIRLPEDTAKKK